MNFNKSVLNSLRGPVYTYSMIEKNFKLRFPYRVARNLKTLNPSTRDEDLFHDARRIVVAEWQHIVYNEWLPIILGQQFMSRFGLYPLTQGYSFNYRNDFDPRITNAFASAAFRIGHTLIPGIIT